MLALSTLWSYSNWRQTGYHGLPLFSTITGMYWLFFGLQLFWGDRLALDWRNPRRILSEGAITDTMLLAVLGVACLRLGMNSRLGRALAPTRQPELVPRSLPYMRVLAVLGSLLGAYGALQWSGGEGMRQVILIFEETVPIAAFVILLLRVLDGKGGLSEKLLVLGVMVLRISVGVSSGWLGGAVALAIVCALVYLRKHHKLPVAALMLVLPYVLFFQAGKTEFRRVFWYSQTQATNLEKLEFWLNASLKKWTRAIDDPSGEELRSLAALSLARTSLLTQAANVIEQTPQVVPYQHGRLYSYLGVALVPRFLWPQKPSMNEANQFYQVAYGVTSERDLNHISIAVGVLAEGFINFGWVGSALVMFLVGVLLDFWNETFFSDTSTSIIMAIGIAMVPQLLLVEYQLAQYLSGIVQHVALALLVFLPVLRWPRPLVTRTVSTPVYGVRGVSS